MKHDTARGSATRASLACNCSSPFRARTASTPRFTCTSRSGEETTESRPVAPDHSHAGPVGPVCQRCESTDADSLKAIVQQQQDDAVLDLVGLCRVWRVTQSSRGCALWLGVRALSSSPTPLARYRTCVQVWRRCSILGEVSVQCSRWLDDWTSRLIHAAIYYDHR